MKVGNFPKCVHTSFIGTATEKIIPEPEHSSKAVMVQGGSCEDLPHGLVAVIAKANSVHFICFPSLVQPGLWRTS